MGKRVIKQQASSKIKKKDHRRHHHHIKHQQQLDSLIKVLKPKVYITDSSSFIQLVQDLTGNNGSPPSLASSSKVHELHHHHQVQFSVEASVSPTTTSSSDEFCNNDINNINDSQLMTYEEDDLDLFFCSNIQMMILEENDTVFEEILACDYDQINYLESLLFDEQVVVDQESIPSDIPFMDR